MSSADVEREFDKMNRDAELGGGKERVDDQHKKGKLTARERINFLLDPGTFNELDKFVAHRSTDLGMDRSRPLGDGVVTGYGKIDGRLVYVYAHDFTIFGGSLGEALMKKVTKVMDLALKNGAPIVGLNDSGGARIQEGVLSLAGVSELFFRNTLASGVVPQISAVVGPSAGAAAYSPALTDFVFMVKGIGQMFVTGPDVVKAALGEKVTFEELGGASVHANQSGVVHFVSQTEEECFSTIRRLLSFLPQNNSSPPPSSDPPPGWEKDDPGMDALAPEEPFQAYDIRKIIWRLVDGGDFLEAHAGWAQNVIVGFARLAGVSLGVVANQPAVLSGALDVDSSDKAARFVRFCDSFNIPILTLVDVPGYIPGTDQEHHGLIRHGAKLLYAYSEATVPKVTLIVKRAYGGAYCAMGSKYSRADINYAWPGAEIAVMGPEGAISILYRKEIDSASDPDAAKKRLAAEYRKKFCDPYSAAARGIIDEVILPSSTRRKLAVAFESMKNKSEFRPSKKHGNIPL